MIITFLYTGQVQMRGVEVEVLFEVLENARMIGVTDLEKELKDFIRLNLVAQALIQGKKDKAKLVFNVLNHGITHQFPELVKTCLLVSKEFLQSSALELPYGYRGFLQLEEGVWSELGVLTSSSLALLMSTFSPQLAAWVVSFALQEDFWKGREVEVFKEVGPEIETEALEMLQDQTLLKILAFAGREELESRVTQVLVEREEMLLALETDVEVKREAREAVAGTLEQGPAIKQGCHRTLDARRELRAGLKTQRWIRLPRGAPPLSSSMNLYVYKLFTPSGASLSCLSSFLPS